MDNFLTVPEYNNWLSELKAKIRSSQIKAAVAVNSELIKLYWELGWQIVEKQKNSQWGSHFIDQLSIDLKAEFPGLTGFSRANLFAMRKFYLFHTQNITIVQQVVGQTETVQQLVGTTAIPEIVAQLLNIPWSHNILIIEKTDNYAEAIYYINETIVNNWSRAVLEYQIETKLFKRQGKSINNFSNTLPLPQSDLANQIIKDPYNFEFLTLEKEVREIELEKQLVKNITQFLLELGKGFAYMGRQFPIKVGKKDYHTDLLFYQIQLQCYVIIELKMTEFEPEHIGKLNFYMNAINELIATEKENTTIGILLCKGKDNFEVEFALKDVNNPIGVSEFTYKQLPTNIKSVLPDAEILKQELKKVKNDNS